jgi:hypothetical protein
MTFLLGLTGWSGLRFSSTASFDLLAAHTRVEPALLDNVATALARSFTANERELADELHAQPLEVHAALTRLVRLGRAMFDVETRAFRHRELFGEPIDEARIYPPDPRVERAAALLSGGLVRVRSCEQQETRKERRLKTPEGPAMRTIIHRDWRVTGMIDRTREVEIVINDQGRVIFGTCTCPFFQENLLGSGPCEHMIALHRASEELRRDLPSSLAATMPPQPLRAASRDAADEDDESADDDDDNVDADEDDENASR